MTHYSIISLAEKNPTDWSLSNNGIGNYHHRQLNVPLKLEKEKKKHIGQWKQE